MVDVLRERPLVVTILRVVERMLDREPHVERMPAMQGTVALELARHHALDLHLPDMTGLAVLERLTADAATSAVPVVVLSGDDAAEHIGQMLSRAPAPTCPSRSIRRGW